MYIYRLVLLLVVGIYLFSPAIMDWWIDPNGAWSLDAWRGRAV